MSAGSDLSDLLKAPDASLEAKDDFFAINALYLEKGWGDGLPLIQIPHPLGGLGIESVQGRAEVAVAQVVDLVKVLLQK